MGEVILSFAMESLDVVLGPRLPELLGEWFSAHPNIESAPPYLMAQEYESATQAPFPSFPLPFMNAPETMTRYWLSSPDGVYAIQVQPDYFALNWRRKPDQRYVHYGALRERFEGIARSFTAALAKYDKSLLPTRAELTYINVIEPMNHWRTPGDTFDLFRVGMGGADVAENIHFAYSRILQADSDWTGRMHAVLLTGFDRLSKEYRLSLNITCRSRELVDRDLSSALAFLDEAHKHTNAAFLALLTDKAREIWGFNDR